MPANTLMLCGFTNSVRSVGMRNSREPQASVTVDSGVNPVPTTVIH